MECYLRLGDHRDGMETIGFHQGRSIKRLAPNIRLIAESYYRGTLIFTHVPRRITRAELFLNDSFIGEAVLDPLLKDQSAVVAFRFASEEASLDKTLQAVPGVGKDTQLFLLHYDLVHFSINMSLDDGELCHYKSDFYACTSRSSVTAENVLSLITSLSGENDSVNRWIYGHGSRASLWEGGGQAALETYLQLLVSIYRCYEQNYSLFKNNVRHKIAKENFLQSYNKLRSINTDGLQWLFRNSTRLARVSSKTAIQINGQYYLPYQMPIETSVKSLDIYENRLVLGFLLLVYRHGRDTETRMEQSIEEEEVLLSSLLELEAMEGSVFLAPIIMAKRMQLKGARAQLECLRELLPALAAQYTRYREILPCREGALFENGLPKKTKIFQEVRTYRQVFEQILAWYHFSDFALLRKGVFSPLKKMDTIFEHYCLRRLLLMLNEAGFQVSEATHYVYQRLATGGDADSDGVANTYHLRRGEIRVTLYYTPYISVDDFENGISLFKTTSKSSFYTPDFMFKIESSASREALYIIMDAKYSTRTIIRESYLQKTIFKYACELSDARNTWDTSIRMVWLLEGRIDDVKTADALEWLHSSSLAKQYHPIVSYGIVAINEKTTRTSIMMMLWQEIERIITGMS
ncbi:MAG: DUF2357 domain-containing protein [Treponema sp.]|jgi:hypothetical protein|nr:DUF2357 domain-containing protein [Treponema sp.]